MFSGLLGIPKPGNPETPNPETPSPNSIKPLSHGILNPQHAKPQNSPPISIKPKPETLNPPAVDVRDPEARLETRLPASWQVEQFTGGSRFPMVNRLSALPSVALRGAYEVAVPGEHEGAGYRVKG